MSSTLVQSTISRKTLLTVFLIVFIDLVGFGIIIPLHPYLADKFEATSLEIGLLVALYSLMQCVFSPIWGRISDIWGRRPVILISLFGASLSHLFFAYSTELWMLFLARGLAGICGANISTAMACIADLTEKKKRSQYMGFIGAAFGLGFTLGPFLGAGLIKIGENFGSLPPFGESFAALGASIICFLNLIMAWFFLKESLDRKNSVRSSRWFALIKQMQKTTTGQLMMIFFCYSLAMASMELPLFLYVKDIFKWTAFEASLGFAGMGLVLVFTQGFLVKLFLKKWGEAKVLLTGLLLGCLGYLSMGFFKQFLFFSLSLLILALGIGFISPAVNGCISLLASPSNQGETLGANQSLSALGRIFGPLLGTWAYSFLAPSAPFYIGAGLLGLAIILFFKIRKQLPEEALETLK